MSKEEMKALYNLATSQEVLEYRNELLNYIVSISNSNISSDEIRGMLRLINNTMDKWITDYELLAKKEKNKEE